MVFASPIFLFLFMPLTLLLYWIAPKKVKNALLLVMSLLFYAWGEPVYVLLMLFSIAANFLLAQAMDKRRGTRAHKGLMIAAVILDLGMLAVFKYTDFVISSVNSALKLNLPGAGLALPVGISFYTFQILSYVIDVYRGTVPVQKSIVAFGAYVTMFPQLIAGPIVRYSDIAAQLEERKFSINNMAAGVRRFCVGLAKKVLIANAVAELADAIFALRPESLTWPAAWMGAIAYAIQIYFDFSGYSDMAIGLGKLLGFEFNENFNYPYISRSIREFWRRWHISLSSWFRDYLYIPLGGNRKGRARMYLNLVTVFTLCGLWHGANWTFVVWGLYHGLFLVIERLSVWKKIQKVLYRNAGVYETAPWVTWMGAFYALPVVLIGWVFFRADTLAGAFGYIGSMFSGGGTNTAAMLLTEKAKIAMIAGAIFSMPVLRSFKKIEIEIPWLNSIWHGAAELVCTVVSLALLALCMVTLAGSTYNPFIYFRF